ncbi:MAG: YbaN family protein [Halioglobus sp.]
MKSPLYKLLGLLFLLLGVMGIVLPVLPTTPFILLAAWFFAQSSEQWHKKLLDSELFGPMIQNWETNRCITLKTKIVALTAMTIVGSASVIFAISNPALKIATVCLLGIGAIILLLLKTCPDCKKLTDKGQS